METQNESWRKNCPITISEESPRVKLAHGEGGRLTRNLIRDLILPHFASNRLVNGDDATTIPASDKELAFTSDSYVVSPLFFPGGDIGKLAVCGTINDLSVKGAKPVWMSLSLIIEEGFPIELLDYILDRIAKTAKKAEVEVATGDTKVVPVGAADGIFINTSGIGIFESVIPPGANSIQDGDELVVSGPIGKHGISVLCAREELELYPPPESDCDSLYELTSQVRDQIGPDLRAMRDATRGGVAAVLHEWAESSGMTLMVQESDLPVSPDVRGACELLGLDPLHVANEGTMLVAVANGRGEDTADVLRAISGNGDAAVIGKATSKRSHPVVVQRILGVEQPLDDPLGTPLPRIC